MDALLLATFNALWQGAALVVIVTLALRSGLRRNATTACVVWSVAFLVVAVLPVLDLALARPATAPPPAPARSDSIVALVTSDVTRTADATTARVASHVRSDTVALPLALEPQDNRPNAARAVAERAGTLAVQLGGLATGFSHAWGPLLVAAWSLVAGTLLLRLALAYAAVARVKRTATPLDDPTIAARLRAAGHRRRATVASSDQVEIPCAIGFRRPMILIPAGLAASLDADDFARVVLHESAHLQRYDDCVNALEQIVCALQFFQPALYLARRRIGFEREVACDDRVLEDSGEPLRYAECLARIVQRHVRGRQAAVVPGFVLRRTQVVARVRRIVDRSRDASPHLRFAAFAAGGALLVATLGIARLQVPVVAPAAATPAQAAPAANLVTSPAPARAPRSRVANPVVIAPHATLVRVAAPTVGRARLRCTCTKVAPRPVAPRSLGEPVAAPTVIVVRAPRAAELPTTRVSALPPLEIVSPAKDIVATARLERLTTRLVSSQRLSTYTAVVIAGAPRVARDVSSGLGPVRVTAYAFRAGTDSSPRRDDDLLTAIDDAKYPHPSVDELIALKNHGISASYVRTMGALGAGRPTLQQLIQLADQGVSAAYLGTLQRDLATPPSIDQAIALRMRGVSATWLEALAATGYPKLSADDAVELAQQGVSASFVRGLIDAGLRAPTPAQLIELRNQGVDGTFVRRLSAHGYKNLGVDELVRLRMSGVSP